MKRLSLLLVLMAVGLSNGFAQNKESLTLREDNIEAIIAAMTNEEKVT